MLIAVDIGNTNIVLGVFRENDLIHHWRLGTDFRKTSDEYAVMFHSLFELNGTDISRIKGAIISSVVPSLNEPVKRALEHLFRIEAMILSCDAGIGLENRYERPEEVGMDRLANAVAAVESKGFPVIVVDFGTAVTLDVVDKNGAYAGGIIMPGLGMGADALFRHTSKLPRISIEKPRSVLGVNTIGSIQSGLFYGTAGAAGSLIEKLWKELGYQTGVIATGGSAPSLIREIPHVDDFDPYLILRGLKIIWSRNSGKETGA